MEELQGVYSTYVTEMLDFHKILLIQLLDFFQPVCSGFKRNICGSLKTEEEIFVDELQGVYSTYVIEMLDFHKILVIQLLEFFQPVCSALKLNICGSLNV